MNTTRQQHNNPTTTRPQQNNNSSNSTTQRQNNSSTTNQNKQDNPSTTQQHNSKQLQRIDFSTNWNNKLSCKCYTTIRLASNKYQLNEEYEVYLQGKKLHNATVVDIRYPFIDDLDDFRCFLDTGYSAEETKSILKKMYKDYEWSKKRLCIVLLQQTKNQIPQHS